MKSGIHQAFLWLAALAGFAILATIGVLLNVLGGAINSAVTAYALLHVWSLLHSINLVDREIGGCEEDANELSRLAPHDIAAIQARDDQFLLKKVIVQFRDSLQSGSKMEIGDFLQSWRTRLMAPIENAATAAAILPMLGFIGTVLGLMISLGSMSNGVAATSDPEAIKASLQVTLSGMTLCFSTTLFGCGGALVLRPLIRILDKKTDELIADVTSYTSTWRTEIQK